MAETGDVPQNSEEKGIVPIGQPYSKNKYETPTRLTEEEYVQSVLNKGENEPVIKVRSEVVDDNDEKPESGEPLPRNESRRADENANSFEPSWIITDEEELKGLKNDSLRRRILRLHEAAKNSGLLSKEDWTKEYLKLMQDANEDRYPEDNDLIDLFLLNMGQGIQDLEESSETSASGQTPPFDPEITDALRDVAGQMGKAAEAQERMARGEYILDLEGMDRDHQRMVVRHYLGSIERSNRDTHDIANAYLVRSLEAALDKLDKTNAGLAREIRARLSVHDCSELIKQAGGWIFRESDKVGPGFAIGSATAEAERRGHELNREIVETLFSNNALPGLDVSKAWDILQDMNNRDYYQGIVVMTSDDKYNLNLFTDGDPARKEEMERFAIDRIIQESGELQHLEEEDAREAARVSFGLAQKLARATLEESVFNRGAPAGNDQAGEFFGLKEWRAGRREKGRLRGPMIHEESIEGFGTSWLRASVEQDNTNQPLRAEIIKGNLTKIKSDWVFYCTVVVTRYKLLNELILDLQPKPDTFNKAFMQNAVIYFLTADKPESRLGITKKNGPRKLRTWWAAGVVDTVLANVDLGWDSVALDEFRKALTQESLSGDVGPFLSTTDWNWIKKATDYNRRLLGLEIARTVKGLQGRK